MPVSDYLDEQIETMPRPNLEELQVARLGTMLRHAYARAPLIRGRLDAAGVRPDQIDSLSAFAQQLPFMTKEDVLAFRDSHNSPCGGLVEMNDPAFFGIGSTSGTTGDPMPIARGRLSPAETCQARDAWAMGCRSGDYFAHVLFTFRIGHYHEAYARAGLVPIFFDHNPSQIARLVDASSRFAPTGMAWISSVLINAFEQHFEQGGSDPRAVFASYKGAIFGGEVLGDRHRRLVESWGLRLFEGTNIGDIGTAAECSQHDGMHVHEDITMVECLDPVTDEPVADGQPGELIVTSLANPQMPLIRYRTEDLVTMDRSPCACGRTHARIKVLGRKSDRIVVAGRTIMPRDVQRIVDGESETRAGLFQIIRSAVEMPRLKVRVGYDSTRTTDTIDRLQRRLESLLSDALHIEVEVMIVPDGELLRLGPPHKIPRVTKQ